MAGVGCLKDNGLTGSVDSLVRETDNLPDLCKKNGIYLERKSCFSSAVHSISDEDDIVVKLNGVVCTNSAIRTETDDRHSPPAHTPCIFNKPFSCSPCRSQRRETVSKPKSASDCVNGVQSGKTDKMVTLEPVERLHHEKPLTSFSQCKQHCQNISGGVINGKVFINRNHIKSDLLNNLSEKTSNGDSSIFVSRTNAICAIQTHIENNKYKPECNEFSVDVDSHVDNRESQDDSNCVEKSLFHKVVNNSPSLDHNIDSISPEIKNVSFSPNFKDESSISDVKHQVVSPDSQDISWDCSEQATPNTSRSCTPIFFGGASMTNSLTFSESPSNSRDGSVKLDTSSTQCKWKDCDIELDTANLMDHIRECHVNVQNGQEMFVCLWVGCKVFNKSSCSISWLERHIVSHSGDKPFKCIVDGCDLRFTSQTLLERHVNQHFNTPQTSQPRIPKHRDDTPTKMWKKRKLKRKKSHIVKSNDFFDNGIMEKLQEDLIDVNWKAALNSSGGRETITFHSTVIGQRTDESGNLTVLLHWQPEDVLPDSWVLESQVPEKQFKTIPLSKLPHDVVTNLHPSLYRQHRFRKHRRK